MAVYRQSRSDRAKAAAAAVVVHLMLGAAFLTGLITNISQRKSDSLKTFDVTEPPPPPVVEVPIEESAPKGDAGEAGKKAEPTPIVVPPPKIPVPARSPVAVAPVPGQGTAATAGATNAGTGTGAGGTGSGLGGGGTGGSGAGFTPARKITKIPDREYRRIKEMSGMSRGSVGLNIRIGADGTPSNCRIARTSGNPSVDALMCQLTLTWVRFRPALDPRGRPVAQDITWYPDWSPR